MRYTRAMTITGAAAIVVATITACGTGGGVATAGSTVPANGASPAGDGPFTSMVGQKDIVIQARDNSFTPQHVVISAGTTVSFDNRGRNPHNVIPVNEGAFTEVKSEAFNPGDKAAVTFTKPGDYAYYCSLHGTKTAGMVGTIRVEQ